MKLTFHGGCREVGRLGTVVEDDNKRILLDYGIKITPSRVPLDMHPQHIHRS